MNFHYVNLTTGSAISMFYITGAYDSTVDKSMYVDSNEIAYIPFINSGNYLEIIAFDLNSLSVVFDKELSGVKTTSIIQIQPSGSNLVIVGTISHGLSYGFLSIISNTGTLSYYGKSISLLSKIYVDPVFNTFHLCNNADSFYLTNSTGFITN